MDEPGSRRRRARLRAQNADLSQSWGECLSETHDGDIVNYKSQEDRASSEARENVLTSAVTTQVFQHVRSELTLLPVATTPSDAPNDAHISPHLLLLWTTRKGSRKTGRTAARIGCPPSQRFSRGEQGLLSICLCSSPYNIPVSKIFSEIHLVFFFSLFLQREGAEDILDFWLDVQQHENLCRAYFKDVRKSGRTIKEDWPQYWEYARRRGSIYGTVVGLNQDGMGTKRSTASTGEMLSEHDKRNLAAAGSEEKGTYAGRSTSPRPGTGLSEHTRVGTSDPDPVEGHAPRSSTPFSLSGRTPTLFNLKRASRAPTVIPRSAAISRLDLIASAERIFYRYLSPAGNTVNSPENHEIYLPPALRIHSFPLSSSSEPRSQTELALMAQIPDIFHAQKEYCFRAMEQDAFPRFLRSKAFGNLTPISALVRLILGLIILWIGLATAFALVFLDVHPKSKRFYVSVPSAWHVY